MAADEKRPDGELVVSALAGDRASFDTLVQRHFGVAYAIAYGRLGQRESAEDLAQEVFVRAHLNLRALRDTERFAAWICRMTRNLAIDWTRRAQTRSQLLPLIPFDDVVEAQMEHPAMDPRQTLIHRDQQAEADRALQSLPPQQRELVMLHFIENLSMRQIAERLGVHVSTVSRQIELARRTMQRVLQPDRRQAASGLRARPAAALRASALVAVVAASPAVQAKVAAAAKATLAQGGTQTTGAAAAGLMAQMGALATTGAKVMSTGKVVAAIAVATVGIGAYVHFQRGEASPQVQIERIESQATALATDDRPQEIYRLYRNAQSQTPFATDPFAGLIAAFGAMRPGEDMANLLLIMPAVVQPLAPTLLQGTTPEAELRNFSERDILRVQITEPVGEGSVAFVRYRRSRNDVPRIALFVQEDGLWKFMGLDEPEAQWSQAMAHSGLRIENGRLVDTSEFERVIRQEAQNHLRGRS